MSVETPDTTNDIKTERTNGVITLAYLAGNFRTILTDLLQGFRQSCHDNIDLVGFAFDQCVARFGLS